MKLNGSINKNEMTFKPDGMGKVGVSEVQKHTKTVSREYGHGGYVEGKEKAEIERTSYVVEIDGVKGRVESKGDLNGQNRMRFTSFKNQ